MKDKDFLKMILIIMAIFTIGGMATTYLLIRYMLLIGG